MGICMENITVCVEFKFGLRLFIVTLSQCHLPARGENNMAD